MDIQKAEYKRQWCKDNPDKVRAGQRRYREKHKERLAAESKEKRDCDEWRMKHRDYQAQWRKRNPEKLALYYRKHKLKKQFRLSLEEYDELLLAQEGRCGICRCEPSGPKSLAVDHDHKTNTIRGLLCHQCNRSLGGLGDNEEGLRRALEYLLKDDAMLREDRDESGEFR